MNESNTLDSELTNRKPIHHFAIILVILFSILIALLLILIVIHLVNRKNRPQINLINNPENRFPSPSLNLNPQGGYDLELKQEEIKLDIIDSNR